MKRSFWVICSALIIVVSSMLPLPPAEEAQADTGSSPLERLVIGADAIVIGTAIEQSSYWNDERTRIYTSVILSVQHALKGTTSDDKVAVVLPGGEVDEMGEWVSDAPRFGEGERALVFLEELSRAELPDVQDLALQVFEKQFQVLGNYRGKFPITGDRVGDLPLDTFKDQISKLINGQAVSDEELDVPVSVITSPYLYSGFSWPHPPPPVVDYRINENTSDCIGEGAAVQAAAATWNAAGALFSFSYAGTTTAVVKGKKGVNEVMWRNLGNVDTVALATTWYNPSTRKIVECDVEFNDYYSFSTAATPPFDRFDVQTIALHEFGHWLMLDDLYDPGDSAKVMYGYGSPGEVKRTLHADDIAGIRHIYGVAQTPPDAPSDLIATAISSYQISLTWQDNSDNETGFRIERKTGSGSYSQIATVGAGITAYTDSTLSASITYYYRVNAYSASGSSGYSNEAWVTTLPASNNPPNPPSNPSPADHAVGISINADLSWSGGDPDVGDTVTYDVYFGTSSTPPRVSDDQPGTTYDPGTLIEDTKYYWYIVATDNHGAPATGPLWDFTTQGPGNNPPYAPSSPSPANHAGGVSINADLSWTGGDPDAGDTVTYDVYFGATTTLLLLSDDQSGTAYNPGTLANDTKYYWQIVATDNYGASTTGPLWDFTTQTLGNNPPNMPDSPSPANHAAGIPTSADLSWTGGDPDAGDTVTYDVYFGATTTLLLLSDDQSGTAYNPGTLANDTKYYWQIVATDNHGASTTGPLWDFTTIATGGPGIAISPTSFDVTLPPNTIQDYALTIGNEEGVSLSYDISDRDTTGESSWASRENLSLLRPANMVPEVPVESSPVEPQNTTQAQSGWQNIMTDGFEGTFPGVWEVWAPAGAVDAYWGKDSYNPHTGSHSAFCARSGSAGVNPPADYPNDMYAWMIYGPFSLEDAIDAELNFYCWVDTEYDYDLLWWGASIDDSDYYGPEGYSGNSGGWVSESFDLTDVYTLGNLCGQPEVWIAFIFESDEGISYQGAFVDDVVLRKYVGTTNNPPNTPSAPSPANHASGVSINADFSWGGGDPDAGDTVTYSVYFGTSTTPSLFSEDQSGTTCDPGTLVNDTKYYWQIVATDDHGASTTGPLWDFTTVGIAGDCAWLDEDPKSGSVPSGGSIDITVVINTAGLAEGDYAAEIVISNSDPDDGPKVVPVTLRVRAPGSAVTWDLPWGLDADSAAVNIWTYPGDAVVVTLADVEWSMPSGLLIWYYGGPVEGWRFYKKGWSVVNTLETLIPGKGYIAIVPTASVWEIPQG